MSLAIDAPPSRRIKEPNKCESYGWAVAVKEVGAMRRLSATVAVLGTTFFLAASDVQAAELKVLASNGIKAAVEELKPQLEKASGSTLSIDFNTAATLRERIEKGEAFDVAILT